MYGGKAMNCTFNNNNASNAGGAVSSAGVSTDCQFNNNNAPEGADKYDVTEYNVGDAKTFADLNATINGNDESDVYLDGNYTFNFGTDIAFKNGILIDRAVTIHGNGAIIHGSSLSSIFRPSNENVVFKNITFAFAHTEGNGSAINGVFTAIDCDFYSNTAKSSGGAVPFMDLPL